MKSYRKMAHDDAIELIQEYFKDEIVEQLSKNGRASDDIYNDYANGDEIFHEVIIDRDYKPYDAVILLDELGEYQEDDSGLWEGLTRWDDMLATIAAYTYGNAVMAEWRYHIKHINEVGKYDLNNTGKQTKFPKIAVHGKSSHRRNDKHPGRREKILRKLGELR